MSVLKEYNMPFLLTKRILYSFSQLVNGLRWASVLWIHLESRALETTDNVLLHALCLRRIYHFTTGPLLRYCHYSSQFSMLPHSATWITQLSGFYSSSIRVFSLLQVPAAQLINPSKKCSSISKPVARGVWGVNWPPQCFTQVWSPLSIPYFACSTEEKSMSHKTSMLNRTAR